MYAKKIVSLLLVILIVFSIFSLVGCNEQDLSRIFLYEVDNNNLLFTDEGTEYSQYYEKNSNVDVALEDIVLNAKTVNLAHSPEYLIKIENIEYAFIDQNSEWIEWKIYVPKTAFYTFAVDYRTIEGTSEDILLDLKVDGEHLYDEMKSFTLYRQWVDNIVYNEFETDELGNDVRPVKVEEFVDISADICDEKGFHSNGFGVALEEGTHTIRLSQVNNGVLIKNLILKAKKNLQSYENYFASIKDKESLSKENIKIEAEHPLNTNASSVYAVNDWTDVATTPNSPKNTMLNAIGDNNWKMNGQKVTWKIYVEKSGYYAVSLRARQDYSEGMNTYRSLYIDGEIPFKEAKQIKFPYDFNWKTSIVGGENPYYFWLEKGEHELSLAVDTSAVSSTLLDLEDLINDLNLIYRKIIIITGTTVDIYQDYDLEVKIPELVNSLKDCANRMRKISNKIARTNETEGSIASVLEKAASTLDTFIAHPYQISGGLATYKSDVDDISTLLTNMSQQALLLDKITLIPKNGEAPKNNAGFFENIKFSLLKYIASYSLDAQKKGKKKNVKVWVSTGRDQAQIIKQMISNSYKNNKEVNIELSIVDTGNTLIQAALAGRGPDVALSIPSSTPVNLAMRDGLVDLSKYVDNIYDDFHESAWTQLRYKDGIYGIPETQIFDMLFIRDDIFEEIGLSGSPKTWDEFYKYMEVIQNNNLMVGIIETNSSNVAVSGAISTFAKKYFQHGGTFFNDDFSETTFNSELAIDTMSEVAELYSRYGLDRSFDFFNRFRSGELVMAISSYNSYNQLIAAAPEISGSWSMYPIPGTVQDDGSINNLESSSGTASVILKAAEEHNVVNEAVDFLLWWTGSDAQSEFAERLEGAMGVAARYTPANKAAFDTIKWSNKESTLLKQQWSQIYNVREIPGNYYIERSLTSAVRNTITGKNSIRYNMTKYTKSINVEIMRKRKEFGLE